MKLLVIGIDGGTKRIIEAMDMPFLQEKLTEGINLNLKEDLWSRGWVEILDGLHGRDSGAFYYRPKLNGSHDIYSMFGTDHHRLPLWKRLHHCKVGFYGLPTTFPAPEVNGFFVSGPGGGFNPKEGIRKRACYPGIIYNLIKDDPWQIRFMSSGIKDFDKFISAITDTIENRGLNFKDLCSSYNPDLGFLMHGELKSVQNIAMSEIEEMIDNNGNPQTYFQKKIKWAYNILDVNIEYVVRTLNPDYLIIVSDHGSAPRKRSINMNKFLVDNGFQYRNKKSDFYRKTRNKIKPISPNIAHHLTDKEWEKTQAFGCRYVPGVYINDDRFHPSCVESDERESLIYEIINSFNENQSAIENDLYAVPYKSSFPSARYKNVLPDIWIDHDDTTFFEGSGPFIELNKDYHRIKSLKDVKRDLWTGIKGRHPLACIDSKLLPYSKFDDPKDLTKIYRIIVRAMQ